MGTKTPNQRCYFPKVAQILFQARRCITLTLLVIKIITIFQQKVTKKDWQEWPLSIYRSRIQQLLANNPNWLLGKTTCREDLTSKKIRLTCCKGRPNIIAIGLMLIYPPNINFPNLAWQTMKNLLWIIKRLVLTKSGRIT